MWENEYRKTVIRNIILATLIVVILLGLLLAMIFVRKSTEEHDAQLLDAYSQQQQEQSEARQEAVTAIDEEYEKDMQTVAQYLPGIVCWGDTITAGSSGNVSYPYVLQKYIDAYICDIYDFRLSISNADDYSRLDWDKYTVEIPVVNMGAGPENADTVLGRSGAVPYVLGADLYMAQGTDTVEIKLLSQNGSSVEPLTGGSVGVNNVNIGGVEGVLSLDSESYKVWSSNIYYFTRLDSSQELYIPAGTVVETAASDKYKDYIHVVCIGTYDSNTTPDELVEKTKALVARQTSNTDRYIVLGICSYNGSWNVSSSMNLDVLDTAMVQAFGSRYINVRKYLCEDGLSDAGISATKQDLSDIQYGIVPESLRSPTGDAQLNGKAYSLIGKLVYERMESLGYFNEVVKELYIEETTKQLLKDDPDYLERVIENSLK